jgi:hypothetical protein
MWCYHGRLMARVYGARRWLILAAVSILASACGSQSADRKTLPTDLPSWIAPYPGSTTQANGSAFVFQTKDQAEKVLDFYQQQLLKNGLHMDSRGGGEYGGFLSAEDDSHSRSVTIDIRSDKGASEVTITVPAKK